MPQYPNDPGMDRQMPVEYMPRDQYKVVTETAFLEAMEEQTKYSYEAARQLAQKTLEKVNEQFDNVTAQLADSNTNLASLSTDLNALRECTTGEIKKLTEMIDVQAREIMILHKKADLSMDGLDHAHLVNKILGRS